MIHEDRFLISRRPYAVDLESLQVASYQPTYNGGVPTGRTIYNATINAVWFRRRKGATVACIGELWDSWRESTDDVYQALEWMDTGRYGGDCKGRWDGERYWGAQEPETIERHLAVLRPMLANFPDIPAGYDGWWTFAKEQRS